MRAQSVLDKIDLHLIRVLFTVLTERSVSRAAIRLGMHQPAVSAALKRLRELAGDPLLVRSGAGMTPTDAGLRMIDPAASILHAAEQLFETQTFDARQAQHTFRLAASDFLDPLFLPTLVAQVQAAAPECRIEIHPLSASTHYQAALAHGDLDGVIGNWLQPPDDLHIGRLFDDEVVCLVGADHPAVRRGWTLDDWLQAGHVAPTPSYPGALGMIDEHLEGLGLRRNIRVRCPHFALVPAMVASSLLVLTTGRQFCERFLPENGGLLPVKILPCPVDFPAMRYYQLWHKRAHASGPARWLRERIRQAAQRLRAEGAGSGAGAAAGPGGSGQLLN